MSAEKEKFNATKTVQKVRATKAIKVLPDNVRSSDEMAELLYEFMNFPPTITEDLQINRWLHQWARRPRPGINLHQSATEDGLYDLVIINDEGVVVLRDRGDYEPMADILHSFMRRLLTDYNFKLPEFTVWYFGKCENEEEFQGNEAPIQYGDVLKWKN